MKDFISKPFNQGIATILGIALSIYLYFISQSYQIPVYILGSSQIIASSSTNKLKIFWDSVQLNNVKVIQIAVLNAGNKYIDKSSFSTTYPITIEPSSSARILSVRLVKKSRTTLNFTQELIGNKQASKLRLFIDGDDGLEGGDGGLFEITYTSIEDIDWLVSGRIKNIPKGFIKPDYTIVSEEVAESKRYEVLKFKMLGIILIIGGLIGFVKIIQVVVQRYKKEFLFSENIIIGSLLAIFCLLFSFIGTYVLILLNVFSSIKIPEWL